MVGVLCMTYQQAKYITDTLNGFCMQQTEFPYLCMVVDDASTDGEQEVINRYVMTHFNLEDASIAQRQDTEDGIFLYAQHKTNKNCFILSLNLKKNLWGVKGAKTKLLAKWLESTKYRALCEGDDYWIDPQKLQKQVTFMEEHPQYTLCYTDYETVNQNGDIITWANHASNRKRSFSGDIFRELLKGNYVQTLTMLFRNDILNDVQYKGGLDYALALQCAFHGRCHYLSEKTGCYRLHADSAIHTINNKISQLSNEIWERYVNRYLQSNSVKRKGLEHIRICGTIDACLISKKRSGGLQAEQAKRVLQLHPKLKTYMLVGVLYRLYHTIMKHTK